MNNHNNDNYINDEQPMVIEIDWDKYAKHLEGSDIPESEKQEFLETLWSVIVSFVDLGFEVHPVQQAQQHSQQQGDNPPVNDLADMVKSEISGQNETNNKKVGGRK
jgi:hypothetical protein